MTEAKISILWESQDPALFLGLWNEMEDLGYSNPEREASMLACFLEFSIRNRGATDSHGALDRLKDLADVLPPPTGAHFQAVHERARRRLDGGS